MLKAGCVLQKIGEARGSKFAYKPAYMRVIPVGTQGETWDLFCLAPNAETPPAMETLRDEFSLAARIG